MLKKIIFAILICYFSFTLSIFASGKEQPIKVFIDGKQITFSEQPFISLGSTYVQFRPIFEELGLSVEWDRKAQSVIGKKENVKITLVLNSKIANVNGKAVKLDAPPKSVNGSIFVPLRFIGESVDAEVKFDKDKSIQINKKDLDLELLRAIMRKDVVQVKILLQKGANPNYTDKSNNSMLRLAIPSLDVEITKLLIEAGADYKSMDKNGNTAINLAISYGRFDIVQLLINTGTYSTKERADTLESAQSTHAVSPDDYRPGIEKIIGFLGGEIKLYSAVGIEEYLIENYSHIRTKLVDISLSIHVNENDNTFFPYDYYINFEYDPSYYHSIINSYRYSIKYGETGNADADLAFKQIKDHIEKAARDVISKAPSGKKFKGDTEYSWYSYPNLKLDKNTAVENSWVNYEPSDGSDDYLLLNYKDSKVVDFKWLPDEDRWRFAD